MSAWINAGLHAGQKQLRNNVIATTIFARRRHAAQRHRAALPHRPLATGRSSGRQ